MPAVSCKSVSARLDGTVECKCDKVIAIDFSSFHQSHPFCTKKKKKKTAWNELNGEIVVTFYIRARDVNQAIDCTRAALVRDGTNELCAAQAFELKRLATPGAAMRIAEGMVSFPARFCAPGTYRLRFGASTEWNVSPTPVLVVPARTTLTVVFYRSGINEMARSPHLFSWLRRRQKPLTAIPNAAANTASLAALDSYFVPPAPNLTPAAATGPQLCSFCRTVATLLPATCEHSMCAECNKRMMIDAVRHHVPQHASPAYCPVAGCGVPLSMMAASACLQPDEVVFYAAAAKGATMPNVAPPRSLTASFQPAPAVQSLAVGYGCVPGEDNNDQYNSRPQSVGYEDASAFHDEHTVASPAKSPSPSPAPADAAAASKRRPQLQRNDRQKQIGTTGGRSPGGGSPQPAPAAVTSTRSHAYGVAPEVTVVPAPGTAGTAAARRANTLPAEQTGVYGAGPTSSEFASPAKSPRRGESVYGDAPMQRIVSTPVLSGSGGNAAAYGAAPPPLVKEAAPARQSPSPNSTPSPRAAVPPPKASAYGDVPSPSPRAGDARQVSRSDGTQPAPLISHRTVSLSESQLHEVPLPNSGVIPPPISYDDDLPPPPDDAAETPPPSPPPSPPAEQATTGVTGSAQTELSSLSSELDARFLVTADEIQRFEKIGEGHSGVVYRGTWRRTAVAIKELKHTDDVKMMAEFRAEARQLVALRPHTNVAQLFGVCLRPLALVSAFYPRGALDRWLKQQPAPLSEAATLRMLLGIASGVYHLHAEGLIHRDLAARNVLLGDGDVPKLTDFGLARAAQEGITLQTQSVTGLPLKWMAPEQLNRNVRAYSSASDVWAFGIVCVEVLTRAPPWVGFTPGDAAMRTLKGERLAMPPHTPDWLRELVHSCWHLSPALRPNMDSCHAAMAGEAARLGVNLSESAEVSAAAVAAAAAAAAGAVPQRKASETVEQAAPEHAGPPEIDVRELKFDPQSDLIGEGTYGKVYRGMCRGSQVAIKVPQQQNLTEQQLADFRNEVAIMRRIFHPNVVLFLGAHSSPGQIMLVSEFLDGGDLDHLLHSDAELSVSRRIGFMMDTAKAMNWLHGINSIVHRDLKPANLLVDEAMRVKVTDFGFSQLRKEETFEDHSGKGSALWLAPEVFLRRPLTLKIDVYAFGLIMWEIWNREWLFPNHSDLAEFRRAITVTRERPPITPEMCVPSLGALMQRCWAHNADERPTFAEVLPLLEVARVESVLRLPGAATFWMRYVGADQTHADWPLFSSHIATATGMPRSTVDVFKPYMLVDERDVARQRVSLEAFADACDKFGAFYGSSAHITWVAHLLRMPCFRGAIDRAAADNELLNQPAGTYLVRFGNKEHPFTISVASPQGGQHKRVRHLWGTDQWMISIDNKTLTFNSLHALLQARECKFRAPLARQAANIKSNPYESV
jgi:serine/threonine protein kinase